MAVDFKPLNRNESFSVAQKAALRKVFTAGQAAATGGNSALVSQKIVHNALAGYFSEDDKQDLVKLFRYIRAASDAADNAFDITTIVSSFHMNGHKRKVIKALGDAVIAQIV